MMRSMYSGVSGLRVHQTKMDVIGNNIANVNTVGFKKSQVTFQELFNQTLRGAGSPQDGRGGTNPQQVGLGVNVATMTVVHSQGSTQMTNKKTDLMIDGNGYFILSSNNGENRFYTRAGNFDEDEQGYLVGPGGYKLLDENMKPIQINKSATKVATSTDMIQVNGNISSNDVVRDIDDDGIDDPAYSTVVDVYDSLGDVHTLSIEFWDKATVGSDSYREIIIKDGNTPIFGYDGADAGTRRYLKFDSYGNYAGIFEENDGTDTDASATMTLTYPGVENIEFNIDDSVFQNKLTHNTNISDAKGVAVNGNSAGTLKDYTIAPNGEVVGNFTNGETLTLARIGLADFDNPAGLMKLGSNLFKDTANSGTPKYGPPASGSFGELNPMALEMSNVDLSQEFTDMITTQRGFQANSRIITTTDEMLQELVNLKR